ncbi:alpha/beta fold hydrolase [Nocardia brasiliensis]
MYTSTLRQRATVNGGTIAFDRYLPGDPILLIHGGLLADGLLPLAQQLAHRQAREVVYFHRRGFGASSAPRGLATMSDWAADAAGLLEQLGIERAHVVGHSIGGAIAVQLALDASPRVRSLVLVEPSLLSLISSGPQLLDGLTSIRELSDAGDKSGAVHAGLSAVFGPGYRPAIEHALPPGAIEQAGADVDTFTQNEFRALESWRLTSAQLAGLTQPILSLRGSDTLPPFVEGENALRTWASDLECAVVPGAAHALTHTHTAEVADHIIEFLARRGTGHT